MMIIIKPKIRKSDTLGLWLCYSVWAWWLPFGYGDTPSIAYNDFMEKANKQPCRNSRWE